MNTILLRCQSCGTVNRVSVDKLSLNPKCGRCKTVLEYPSLPVDVTSSTFHREVLSCPGAVLVEFWSPSCGHCQRLSPLLTQIAAEKAGTLKVVNINTQTEQLLAGQFGIRGVPTLILYKGGKKLRELSGALPKEQLEAWIGDSL
jgi:thioredoxin 2